MAKAKAPAGSRWITLHGGAHSETGEHTGRHVLLDKSGKIIGGAVPKAWQGHSFDDVKKGIAKEIGDSYHGYSHDELKELHKDFKESHSTMQKELAADVHGVAKGLRDDEVTGDKESSLIKKIREKGGIHFSDDMPEEHKQIETGVRKAVGNQKMTAKRMDEMADELGMSEDELVQALKNEQTYQYKKIGDYHGAAKRHMGEEYDNRLKDIEHVGKHVKAIEAAIHRHKSGAAQREADHAAVDEASGIFKKFVTTAEKIAPGSKDAHEKGGINGLLDHLSTNKPELYDQLKAGTAAAVQRKGDTASAGEKKAHELLQKHKAPKKAPEKKPKQAPEEKPGKTPQDDGLQVAADKEPPQQAPSAATTPDTKGKEPQKNPEIENKNSNSGKKNPIEELHNDAQGYIDGKVDVNDLLKKHDKLIQRMAKRTAENRPGNQDHEDLAQHGRLAAAKTLEALKNGTQKPKEGTSLGEHMVRRIKQGMNEAGRQSDENHLTRGASKLAAVVNAERQKHTSEKGAEPSEDELFDRVKEHPDFKNTKYTKPGTKQALEDREKFDELRKQTAGQNAKATLDQEVPGKDGDSAGTVGGNIADEKGSAEDQAIENENQKEGEQQKAQQREQIMGALKEFGLSDSQAHAVIHRFGVGHGDDTGVVKNWDEVAKHMKEALGKDVNPDTAKRHYYDGLKKLHKNIGDERMAGLLQKSLIDSGDMGAYLLVKSLYEMALLDLMKSHNMAETAEFERVVTRVRTSESLPELLKSLSMNEYLGERKLWADGSITARIETYQLRG